VFECVCVCVCVCVCGGEGGVGANLVGGRHDFRWGLSVSLKHTFRFALARYRALQLAALLTSSAPLLPKHSIVSIVCVCEM